MRDYAELISRAGSDQERMTLALAGFGKVGDGMVLALRDGARGFDQLMAKADEAGGVLDEEILRKAAEIDDAFDKMWRNFEINAKSAILSSVVALDTHSASIMNFFKGISNYTALEQMFATAEKGARLVEGQVTLIGKGLDLIQNGPVQGTKGGRLSELSLQNRINDAFGPAQENEALARMLRDRFAPKTVIPGSDSADRKGSTAAAREQASAYEKVIEKLNQEREVLGLNSTEQKIVNELRRAGVTLVSAEGRAIAALVSDIERQRKATEALAEQTEFLKSSTASFFTTFRQGVQAGEGALDSLGNAFLGFIDTLAVKTEERLAGSLIDRLMGSTAGVGFNPFSFLFPSAPFNPAGKVGLFAKGTESAPGGWSIVGEEGPELINVPRGSRILSADRTAKAMGSGQAPTVIHFHIQTPDVEGFRRSENQIAARLNRVMARGARNN
ncbi:MAG: hypothetical protein KL863_08920 [Rhizobium sp.]|nr:hypothetical protein [Rhizobium sp.]